MSDAGEVISALLILIVGAGVIATMAGTDPSIVTDLMASGIRLVVYVGLLAILAITLIGVAREF